MATRAMTNKKPLAPPSIFEIAQAQAAKKKAPAPAPAAPQPQFFNRPTVAPKVAPLPMTQRPPIGPPMPTIARTVRPPVIPPKMSPKPKTSANGFVGAPPVKVAKFAPTALTGNTPGMKPSDRGGFAIPNAVSGRGLVQTTRQPKNKPLTSAPLLRPTKVMAPKPPPGLQGNAARKATEAKAAVAAAAAMPVQPMAPPVTEATSGPGAPPPNLAAPQDAPQAAAPQGAGAGFAPYQPQGAQETGLGENFDNVYNAEVGRENQRGAAYDAAGRELAVVDKNDFTQPWDDTEANFKAEYEKRYGRMDGQWTEQKAAIANELAAQQGRIGTAAANATGAINGAVGQASVNAQNYGQPAPQGGAPMDTSVLGTLGQAGADQLASLSGPAAPTNLRGTTLTPEVMAAMQAQYQATAGANASSASNAASRSNAAQLQDAYAAQGKNENDLLDIFGNRTNNNTTGRTKSINDYYGANQGQVSERNKLLDKQYQESPANKTAMQEIASGGRNTADNVTSRQNNSDNIEGRITTTGMNNDTSRANNFDTNSTRITTTGMNNAQSGANTQYRTDNKTTAASKPSKPKLIKGDEYIAVKLSKSPAAASVVREISTKATTAAKQRFYPGADGKPDPTKPNKYYGDPQGARRALLAANPSKLDKKALSKYLDEYNGGVMYAPPAPKGNAASGGGTGAAKSAFQLLKSRGNRVDGLGSSSAAHKLQNPKSDHDTGKAFDFHKTGPSAVREAMQLPGVRYLINREVIHTKDANGQWSEKPYVGRFANGKLKDKHANHVHVNF